MFKCEYKIIIISFITYKCTSRKKILKFNLKQPTQVFRVSEICRNISLSLVYIFRCQLSLICLFVFIRQSMLFSRRNKKRYLAFFSNHLVYSQFSLFFLINHLGEKDISLFSPFSQFRERPHVVNFLLLQDFLLCHASL